MRALSDSELLDLWEGGLRRHPLDRALLALCAAYPETGYERIAEWPLGRRNRALIEMHCERFGRSLRGWIACTRCGEKLEFELDGEMVAATASSEGHPTHLNNPDQPIVFNQRAFRLPTSRDLAAAAHEPDPRLAAIRIVESCRLEPRIDPGADEWTNEDLDAIGERMALADPLAETRLVMHCLKCDYDWQENLDIAAFLWAEIEARGRRLLAQIHALASAYGWTEAEILSLSDNRRARYLEMVQS
jgi:hypothetical protein